MAVTIPLVEPEIITQGDTIKWRKSLPDYLPSDGWVLTYQFAHHDEPNVSVNATNNGDQTHLVTISATASAAFRRAGTWMWQAYVTLSGERFTVARGSIVVRPDIASVPNADTRSHARKVLDAIEAVLENRATMEQSSIAIGGQSITLLAPEELIRWRSVYAAEVQMEERAEKIRQGLGARRIRTRFIA